MTFLATGCATDELSKSEQMANRVDPRAFEKSLKAADALAETGNPDRAIAALTVLAKDNPIRKEPWLHIAKVRFDQKNYGHAIIAAEEVLQRDVSDKQAKSILVVSGLRVSTQALAMLRPAEDKELVADAQTDARALVKEMRENLGASVLVPPQLKKRPVAKKVAPSGAAKPAGGNPFSALAK